MKELEQISALAQTPDQLLAYVGAVSGMTSSLCGEAILHRYDDNAVLVAYSPQDPLDPALMNESVEEALGLQGLRQLTVLGPERPRQAPSHFSCREDLYWGLNLDKVDKSPKLRNILKRARRDLELTKSQGKGAWTAEHDELLTAFCAYRNERLEEDSVFLFRQVDKYLAAAPEAMLFSARDTEGRLKACAIGDFSAFSTAFYMFAFRYPDAPPGSADLLLDALVGEARERGYERLNLGLGINKGVEFFKKKWGAKPLFPYVESSWEIKRKGWLSRLLGRK